MNPVGPSEWLWKEGAGYYTETESDLLQKPLLPNERSVPDQRLMRLFRSHAGLSRGSEILEIGCGRSPWLPYLAQAIGCRVSGIDIEPSAFRLACANLAGVGVEGQIYCRDGFDHHQNEDLRGRFDLVYSLGVIEHLDGASEKLRALAYYLKPGGRLLSTVPNLQKEISNDPRATPNDKYKVLGDVLTWATNVGYPGYCTAAIDQAFKSWVIPTMFATVANGKATPEDAAKTAEAEYKRIFERFK